MLEMSQLVITHRRKVHITNLPAASFLDQLAIASQAVCIVDNPQLAAVQSLISDFASAFLCGAVVYKEFQIFAGLVFNDLIEILVELDIFAVDLQYIFAGI